LQSSANGDKNSTLRHAIDETLVSLGPSIQDTIMWHMNNRGVFSNPKFLSIDSLYENLLELMGPYAEEIIDLTWEQLQKKYGAQSNLKSRKTIDKIKAWLDSERGES
jgi:hypothetical protein